MDPDQTMERYGCWHLTRMQVTATNAAGVQALRR